MRNTQVYLVPLASSAIRPYLLQASGDVGAAGASRFTPNTVQGGRGAVSGRVSCAPASDFRDLVRAWRGGLGVKGHMGPVTCSSFVIRALVVPGWPRGGRLGEEEHGGEMKVWKGGIGGSSSSR